MPSKSTSITVTYVSVLDNTILMWLKSITLLEVIRSNPELKNVCSHILYKYNFMFNPDSSDSEPSCYVTQAYGPSWLLLFTLCPAVAVFFSLISSVLVYHLCHKTGKLSHTYSRFSHSFMFDETDLFYCLSLLSKIGYIHVFFLGVLCTVLIIISLH